MKLFGHRCTICSHPQAAAITASLDRIGTRKIARQFRVSGRNAVLGIVGVGAESVAN
jgi:hypothetical protein